MNIKSAGLLAIALIVILGVGVFFLSNKGKESVKQTTLPPTQNNETSPTITRYKDGVYTQEGDYTSPNGPEQIEVKLTIKDGLIVQSEVTSKAENPKSKSMQGIFVENYKQFVVGKNIKDLNLEKVAGSSLTPQGFNNALEKIKAQAKT